MGKIDKSQLKPGDHIYSYRNAHAYSHHGIYVGNNMVIHFTRTKHRKLHKIFAASSGKTPDRRCKACGYESKKQKGVVKTCLECFLIDHSIYLFEYDVSKVERPGAFSTKPCDPPKLVIQRATDMLNTTLGFGHYKLFKNNCESFALYCTAAEPFSAQAYFGAILLGILSFSFVAAAAL